MMMAREEVAREASLIEAKAEEGDLQEEAMSQVAMVSLEGPIRRLVHPLQ
tara:strand:+ start:468 stop:617 length:150 start_codon:yes stop_codon:yes gene_type:complete